MLLGWWPCLWVWLGTLRANNGSERVSSPSSRRSAFQLGLYFSEKLFLPHLGITVADFQVAGGLILLGLAGRELLNVAPASREATDDFGVVPLGMPLIAGPALLTALLILVDTVGLVFTIAALLVNLALVVVAFWNADLVARWMGRQGLRGVSKIVALLLAAIAVSLIRRGWHGV